VVSPSGIRLLPFFNIPRPVRIIGMVSQTLTFFFRRLLISSPFFAWMREDSEILHLISWRLPFLCRNQKGRVESILSIKSSELVYPLKPYTEDMIILPHALLLTAFVSVSFCRNFRPVLTAIGLSSSARGPAALSANRSLHYLVVHSL